MKKKKILVLTQYFWPESFRINDLALHLEQSGYDVSILTGIPNYPSGKYFSDYGLFKNRKQRFKNLKITRSFLIPRGTSKFQLFLNYLSFSIFASLKILSFKEKFDCVFIYAPSPILTAIPAVILNKFKKTPSILWISDIWPESIVATIKMPLIIKKILFKSFNPILKFIYNGCTKILVTSKGFIPLIVNKSISIYKVDYLPQWAEPFFKPLKRNDILPQNIPKKSFKIMFAGNIGEAQDFPSIINAAKILKSYTDVQWIILGAGRKKQWVKQQIKDNNLGKCFHLLGSYPIEKMPIYYSNADCLLFSLKKEFIFSITIPAKVQTYLACAKPVLAMIDGEASNLIREANAGFTCPSGDSKSLAENVKKLRSKNFEQLKKMGQNGRKFYEKEFERNLILKKVEKNINDMIEKNKNGTKT